MRALLVGLTAVVCVCLVNSAQAEQRMFVIANDGDAYGIDRCLASGAPCGKAAANAYCKTQAFAEAASFSKVDREEITGAIPTGSSEACHGSKCDDLVAIVCTR
jgi:hypothetical protein